ncbi:MAG: pilus assembly protein [Telluria sp.]
MTRRGKGGFALAVVLFLLLAVAMLTLCVARAAANAQRTSGAEAERALAFAGAEAALRDAERDIEGAAGLDSVRASLFRGKGLGFLAGCGAGDQDNAGLCRLPAGAALPPEVFAGGRDARSVPLGRFTGMRMQTGTAGAPARLPRYVIEVLPALEAGRSAGADGQPVFRITAMGFGADDEARVVLQEFYRRTRP